MIYRTIFKPLLDVLIAVIVVMLLAPIMLITTILLFFVNNGKPFFFQSRPGKNEKLFDIIKFKTMTDKTNMNGNLLPDAIRLTTIGKVVRKTSIDEIPQLFNILKGDMSIIGPRPLLNRYLPFYTIKERKRHSVKPGITGLAQISGRNLLNWDDRLAKDIEYVENLSFQLDVTIFFKTIKNVLTSKDIIVDPNSVIIDLDEYRKKN